MPIMDGYQMVRALRAEEAQRGLPHTPVIALTAATLQGESERAMAAGMDDYLPKPVGIPQLAACLHRWLPHTIGSKDAAPVPAPAARAAEAPVSAASPSQVQPLDALRPLDPEVLAQLTGGDPDEARALLLEYLEATDVDLAGAEQARAAGDLPQLARQAHKIKGAARLVGAEELATIAAALEEAAHGDGPEIPPYGAQLQAAVDRLRLHIAERYPG
jgi:CheY-like chemotaxis protein